MFYVKRLLYQHQEENRLFFIQVPFVENFPLKQVLCFTSLLKRLLAKQQPFLVPKLQFGTHIRKAPLCSQLLCAILTDMGEGTSSFQTI